MKKYSLRTSFTSQNKSKSENLDRLSNKTLEFPEKRRKFAWVTLRYTTESPQQSSERQINYPMSVCPVVYMWPLYKPVNPADRSLYL